MGALPVRAHPPIPPRSMRLASAAGSEGLDLGARRQPRGEALAVQHGPRLRRQSGLKIRADLRLRMRTKAPARDRARCLTSAFGGPYPDTKLPEISRVASGAMPTR